MPSFDPHALTFLIRWLHVISMAFMLGGALLVCLFAVRSVPEENARAAFQSALAYEGWLWLALGIQVITGIGNLGAFGNTLPGSETAWGMRMTLKLGAVLGFMLFSVVRTMLVVLLENAEKVKLRAPLSRVLTLIYGGTAFYLIAVLWLAVALAHG